MIQKEFPELEFYWGKTKSFWHNGFFVETVGQVNEEHIKEFSCNQ